MIQDDTILLFGDAAVVNVDQGDTGEIGQSVQVTAVISLPRLRNINAASPGPARDLLLAALGESLLEAIRSHIGAALE